jgi:hypothetical protein
MHRTTLPRLALAVLSGVVLGGTGIAAEPPSGVSRFTLTGSGLELARPTRTGAFFDVVGRRAAVFGYEHRGFETWTYPLKLVDDFRLAFRVEGYPLEFEGTQIATGITVRPEATTFTYSHAAFTVRQTLFAPVDEPGIVMLLDVDTTLPLTVIGSFRPRLRLMWPAGLMTGNLGWDEKQQVYSITEESKRFAGVIGSPGARDLSVMPYQEEPRDVPARFEVDVRPEAARTHFVPIVIAGSLEGRDKAKETYDRLLRSARELYEANVAYYRSLEERTLQVDTPDDRLDRALRWAKVGVDKGLATNPLLGTGLVAGFRTSGESERPGFAWMFGRDALWTSLGIHSYGDFPAARTALEFLRKLQRDDGKVPHEISQSATLLPWFRDYEFPWASADATPLYVILQADHWRFTGDREFLRESWASIMKAWRFTEATDKDGNGLVENTKVGHGWTEGSPPYPPHEEIYMQGLWVEACRGLAEMAEALGDRGLARRAREAAERTRQAVEKTYWLPGQGFYAFATALPQPEKRYDAEPGPRRPARQARIEALRGRTLVDEDTVLPAVPLWWGLLDAERAQSQIDHLGSAGLAADWGQRLISAESQLYDPLSYHYGSVWPLFTGWASMGAYRYGRPHVGYQALMANVLLTYEWALGYVTELLSGDLHAPFGRSSHHQVWSEAMVVAPAGTGAVGRRTHALLRAAAAGGLGPRGRAPRGPGAGAAGPHGRAERGRPDGHDRPGGRRPGTPRRGAGLSPGRPGPRRDPGRPAHPIPYAAHGRHPARGGRGGPRPAHGTSRLRPRRGDGSARSRRDAGGRLTQPGPADPAGPRGGRLAPRGPGGPGRPELSDRCAHGAGPRRRRGSQGCSRPRRDGAAGLVRGARRLVRAAHPRPAVPVAPRPPALDASRGGRPQDPRHSFPWRPTRLPSESSK